MNNFISGLDSMKFIFFVIMASMLLSGCNIGLKNKVYNNISEMVDFVVVGGDDNMSISLMCGRRELEYKSNGIATQLIPYGVLTLYGVGEDVKEVDYVLFVGTIKYQGDMQKNPYDSSWVADMKTVVDESENISVDILIDNAKVSYKLKSASKEWEVASKDLIDLLIDDYSDILKEFIKDGVFEGEVYIKLINEYEMYANHYYYYVSIVERNGGSFNILVSPTTKEVLASSNTT